jgi:antitoxin MazE
MSETVHSKIVQIGNSRGVRIPRTLLEQAGLTDEIEMVVEDGKLIIHSTSQTRQGWAEAFASMAEQGDDRLLDEISSTQWDDEEWTW